MSTRPTRQTYSLLVMICSRRMEIELKKQLNGNLYAISLREPSRYALFLIFLAFVGLKAVASPSASNASSSELYYIPASPPAALLLRRLQDLAEFAADWPDTMDLVNFTELATQWLECNLYPADNCN